MKLLLCLAAAAIFTLPCSVSAAPAWKNGGTSSNINNVIFGTHDWIVWKAFIIANEDGDFDWLETNQNYMFFGTEAPDLGLSKLPAALRNKIIAQSNGKKYRDTSPCHCVLYGEEGEIIQTFAADRVLQEYNKAKRAVADENWQLAAFYIGAMSHYIADLSQFMHLMGKDSRWNNGEGEDQRVHSSYEAVFDARVDFEDKTLSILEPFVHPIAITASEPTAVVYEVAKHTDTGNGTQENVAWMYDEVLAYKADKILSKPDRWDSKFLNQSGRNVNKAVNAIAKLIISLP